MVKKIKLIYEHGTVVGVSIPNEATTAQIKKAGGSKSLGHMVRVLMKRDDAVVSLWRRWFG